MKPTTVPIRRARYDMGGAPIGLNNLVSEANLYNRNHPKPFGEPPHERVAFASDAMQVLGTKMVQRRFV